MRTRMLVVALAVLSALAFVVPAGAVTINGTDYALFARCKIGMENGPISIDGNIAVNEICGTQQGFLHLGINNIVTGSATANNIFFGNGSQVGICNFNNSTGGNPGLVCGAQNPAVLPITNWFTGIPLPVPAVIPGNQDVVCPPDCNPVPGDYQDIRVKDNATLTLSPGGVYNARSLLVEFGATLNGNGAAVNLKNGFTSEALANINDVTITSTNGVTSVNPLLCSGANGLGTTAEVIETGNGTKVSNSIFYAPCGRMHLHQSGEFTNFEGIAVLITVEPVIIKNEERAVCACIGTVTKDAQNNTLLLAQGCHLNAPNLSFFVAPTCPTDPTVCPGCTPATRQAGATDTTATLDIPVVAPGTYRVVVQSTGGSFCTKDTVSLP